MPDVRLLIDGQRYGGWQRVRIQRGIEQIAGTFELSVSERWSEQATPRPISPGAACAITIDGDPVITGYVDDVSIAYDSGNHSVTVRGRDKTGDLVDCSASGKQFTGLTLLDVATRECDPFGIAVSADVDVGGTFRSIKPEPGETVFEALERLARIRAVLLVSDGNGGLMLTRASSRQSPVALVLGGNILSCRADMTHRDRYSRYTVKGQAAGTDDFYGSTVSQVESTLMDTRIERYRPIVIQAEDQIDAAGAKVRAQWEKNVRFGRSQRITYTIHGWRHSGGLWQPNVRVRVQDSFIGLDDWRLVAGVTLRLDEGGMTSDITVIPPEALALVPVPEPKPESIGWAL